MKGPVMGLDDKIKNAAQDLAGKAKEAVGKATGEDVKDVFKK